MGSSRNVACSKRMAGWLRRSRPTGGKQVISECLARTVSVPAGRWLAPQTQVGEQIGLLVLRGLLIRRVGVRSSFVRGAPRQGRSAAPVAGGRAVHACGHKTLGGDRADQDGGAR